MPASLTSRPHGSPRGARPRFIYPGSEPRTFYFPPGVLERIERGKPPGALVELLTTLLSAHLKGGGR